jgi:hypothetical protein
MGKMSMTDIFVQILSNRQEKDVRNETRNTNVQMASTDTHLNECLNTVRALVPPSFNNVLASYGSTRDPVPVSLTSLASVHSKLKRDIIKHERALFTWHTLLSQADRLLPDFEREINEHDTRIGVHSIGSIRDSSYEQDEADNLNDNGTFSSPGDFTHSNGSISRIVPRFLQRFISTKSIIVRLNL